MTALLAAEWIKVRSVRSTAWTLTLTFVLSVGLAFVFGTSFRTGWAHMSADMRVRFDPLMATFYSLTIGQLALVVLAVFVVTGEFTTGTIRGSLAAVPRRSRFFAAKAATGTLLAAGVAVVTVAATFAAAQAGLGSHGVSPGADGVLEAAAGACLYLMLIFLIALGLAALLRSSIATLSIMLPLLFLGSQGIGFAPGVSVVTKWLPNQAGMMIMHIEPPTADGYTRPYGPWTGLGIMALWAVALLLAGYAAIRRRDP
jgi:ABC-2 type transport system permease protein